MLPEHVLSSCCRHTLRLACDLCRRYYSLFTLGMLVMFECTVVGQRLRNLRELRSLTVPKQALQVYRQGRWDQLPGDALLPGDVISIGRPSGGEPCLGIHSSTIATVACKELDVSCLGCIPGTLLPQLPPWSNIAGDEAA